MTTAVTVEVTGTEEAAGEEVVIAAVVADEEGEVETATEVVAEVMEAAAVVMEEGVEA